MRPINCDFKSGDIVICITELSPRNLNLFQSDKIVKGASYKVKRVTVINDSCGTTYAIELEGMFSGRCPFNGKILFGYDYILFRKAVNQVSLSSLMDKFYLVEERLDVLPQSNIIET